MIVFCKISSCAYFFATAFLFAAAGHFKEFFLIYLAAALHEAAHFAVMTAKNIKIKELSNAIVGFIIKSEPIKNSADEILVAIMGPTANLIAFLIFASFKKTNIFALCNLALFITNLLPALPLDGARIIKALLTRHIGYINALCIVTTVTKITAVIITFFGMIFLIITKYNISLLIIGMFLLYNIKYEKQNTYFIRKNLLCGNFYCQKKNFKIKHIGMFGDTKALKVLDSFSDSYIVCVSVFDRNFNFMGTLWQRNLSDGILKYGACVSADMLLREEKTNEKHYGKNSSQG